MCHEQDYLTPGQRVLAERRRRGWSARTAAQVAGISNTTWSTFERTDIVTDRIREAVADAFGWPRNWPEEPVLAEPTVQQALIEAMDLRMQIAVDQSLANQTALLAKLDVVIDELRAHRAQVEPTEGVDDVLERLAAAVESVAHPPAVPPTARDTPQAG